MITEVATDADYVIYRFDDPSVEEIERAVRDLDAARADKQLWNTRLDVRFRRPTSVVVNRRRRKALTQARWRFFHGAKSKELCYTPFRSNGWPVSDITYSNIVEIALVRPPQRRTRRRRAERDAGALAACVQGRIHAHAFSNLQDADPETLVQRYGVQATRSFSIEHRLPNEVLTDILEAFRERRSFDHSVVRDGRYFRVWGWVNGLGFLEAFYTTQSGWGKRKFVYLLINPTTAAYGHWQ